MTMFRIGLLIAGLTSTAVASAATINLTGSIANSCVLSVSSGGTMRVSAAGTTLGSEESGGSAATLVMVATGLSPTLNFTAPSLSASPVGYNRSPSLGLKYTSLTGANQAYTASSSSYTAGGLLDTLTIDARATDGAGFNAGTYTISTTVTCQQ